MAVNPDVRCGAFERGVMPLDAARRAFAWLVTGPDPVSVDGGLFPSLPHRRVPLNEVRTRLLGRGCGQSTRDAVWAHLVLRSRTEGATWTLGCVGVALPALTRIAATLTARFASDPRDIHAAVLTGFVAELARIDLRKPRVMLRLRWAAYRGGYAALREALDAPVPSGNRCRSSQPAAPWGHPDFVLARAVAENVITASEAELIGSTRLENHSLATVAAQRGVSYGAAAQARRRAEHRLVDYLSAEARQETTAEGGDRDLEVHAVNSVIIATAARCRTHHHQQLLSVATRDRRSPQESQAGMLKQRPHTGVQGCAETPATPAHHTSATGPLAPFSPTPEVPRCA
ncbi:MAG: hypothetical protein ACRDRO_23080 [Pseudonocardiaceae bacterium]